MKKPVVVLGVSGGIAAYKSVALCSELVKSGFEVSVIMTENAQEFVTPLTFRTMSRRPVMTDLWCEPEWQPGHVALAEEADLFVVAPATANFVAKYANGIADDALSTFAATFSGKVIVAPAMNPTMWTHWACRENIEKLRKHGVGVVGPVQGRVACGPDGVGRMSEPEEILAAVKRVVDEIDHDHNIF